MANVDEISLSMLNLSSIEDYSSSRLQIKLIKNSH